MSFLTQDHQTTGTSQWSFVGWVCAFAAAQIKKGVERRRKWMIFWVILVVVWWVVKKEAIALRVYLLRLAVIICWIILSPIKSPIPNCYVIIIHNSIHFFHSYSFIYLKALATARKTKFRVRVGNEAECDAVPKNYESHSIKMSCRSCHYCSPEQ